ncbi:MAG: hypothetical protein WCX31_18230 [Salinivirgaceae bacterium]
MKQLLIFFFLLLFPFILKSQEAYSLYQNHTFRHFDRYVYQSNRRFHTSVKPFLLSQTDSIVSLDTLYRIPTQKKAIDILFNRSLFQYKKGDFAFTVDPLFNFELGKDPDQSSKSWINTRGILVNARLGKMVSVTTSFYENQAAFYDYRHERIEAIGHRIVPGQGTGKSFGDSTQYNYDYGFADASVSYAPNRHFDFTLGHGKNFWGDGYRSLILSDNAFNYPYFRITTDFWHIKYVCLWAQFQDLTESHPYGEPYNKKWGAFHYLDWSVMPWLNIGFFETVIWQHADSTGYRGFDFNYANPVIFMRPVEFSVGSSDNSLMGITGKLTLFKKQVLYGQAIIDEFKVDEMIAGSGWWGNKWGVQDGYKTFDLFGLEHLDIQSEFNYVQPFMYSHHIPKQNYGHYQVSLAHPLGSNFWESVSFLRYNYKRLFLEGRYSIALHGSDTAGYNFGNDIYLSYDTRYQDYGNYVGQAQEVTLQYTSLLAAFLVNPRTNLNVYVNYTLRKEITGSESLNQSLITFGIRTSLQNFYYDF